MNVDGLVNVDAELDDVVDVAMRKFSAPRSTLQKMPGEGGGFTPMETPRSGVDPKLKALIEQQAQDRFWRNESREAVDSIYNDVIRKPKAEADRLLNGIVQDKARRAPLLDPDAFIDELMKRLRK